MPSDEALSPEVLERLDDIAERAPPGPIKGWVNCARILGMSDDTLKKKRVKFGDRTRDPWWRDESAVLAWYERLIAPPEKPAPKRKPPAPKLELGAAVDLRAAARELARKPTS